MENQPYPVVDLTNCDREPIHILGQVQSFGFIIIFSRDFEVLSASKNAGDFLGLPHDEILRSTADTLFSHDAIHSIRQRLQVLRGPDSIERMFGLKLRNGGPLYDVAVHQSGQTIQIDAEPHQRENEINASDFVRTMLSRLRHTVTFEAFFREAARQIKALTGFDRVMIYRFDADGAGEVIAEVAKPTLVSYLGQRYPASDIPKQARILYERNWLRIIPDINATPSPLEPQFGPDGPFDLSMSSVRAVSSMHIEYLQNMGVGASLSISILRDNKLWGLFACHHYSPRIISFERRTAAELFGQMFSWILENREREQDIAYENRARELNQKLMTSMASGRPTLDTVSNLLDELRDVVECDGVAVWNNGEISLSGTTPTRDELAGLVRFLNTQNLTGVLAVNEIGKIFPPAADFVDRAAGMLAVPISRAPRDYLIFFRAEVTRTVTWGGDPTKPATLGPNGIRLTPRKSFEAWQEVVRGQSAHWSDADIRIAESFRVTLLEVILRMTEASEKERKTSQERQELLIAELNHRVRNILGLIRGLINQGRNSTMTAEQFALVVGGRIQALARAHDQITRMNWAPGSVRGLIESEVAAYLGGKADRMDYTGPDVALEPEAFSTLALVVHELVTNSAKYGALSDSTGAVKIDWHLDKADQLVIAWQESGGPPVTPPKRRGFGTTIIERSIPYDLAGQSEIHYELLGVRARLVIPARFVRTDSIETEKHIEAKKTNARGKSLFTGRVLILEDNLIIAMDAEAMMEQLGARHVDIASNVRDAMRSIEKSPPDFALLDINLGNENSVPVALKLLELGIPFAFASGYGERAALPAELERVAIIQKPYMPEAIVSAIPLHEGEGS